MYKVITEQGSVKKDGKTILYTSAQRAKEVAEEMTREAQGPFGNKAFYEAVNATYGSRA